MRNSVFFRRTLSLIACGIVLSGTFFASERNVVFRESWNTAEIHEISTELSSEELEISPIYGDEVTVEISSNNMRKTPEVSFGDGVLSIKSQNKLASFSGLRIKVKIFIPHGFVPDTINVETASGDIDVEDVSAGTFTVRAASGSVEIEDVTVFGEISLRASSGSVEADNVTASRIDLNSSSGKISIEDSECEFLYGKTASGGISAKEILVDSFEISSSSGGISLSLLNEPKAESEISSSSGKINLRIPRAAAFSVSVSSVSGNFSDKINGDTFRPRGEFHSDYNGGGAEIKLSSTSGGISLACSEL